jgi:hypothetical protein
MTSFRIAALAFCLMFFLGSALASEYAFGTKVLLGDSDLGMPLTLFPAAQFPRDIGFWDCGVVPGSYDAGDVVYLHVNFGMPALPVAGLASISTVRANDIRLIPFGNYPAGSKVTPQDNDIGMPLNAFAGGPNAQISWLNLYQGPQYDLQDPVLINAAPTAASKLNDVRLTNSEGMPAGTKLQDSEPDFGKLYQPPIIAASNPIPAINIQLFDVNGNGVYDYPDDVYLLFAGAAAVPINSVRLTGPVA